jgi:hypothetical protein
MRIIQSVLAALAVAAPLLLSAQTPSGPDKGEDPLDLAKTSKYYLRYADEIRFKKQIEESQVMLRTRAFRDALRGYEPGRLPELHITWGAFVSASGTVFVAMQLSPSNETYMKPGTRVVAFGELVDEAGKTITDFEEPGNVQVSKKDVFVERTFFLPVRRSIGTFGIAVGDEIIALGRTSIDYEEITRTSPGASRLIVSNNIYNLPRVQNPFDPFAFGGTKVVPKPDRAFRGTDELWLFAELRNPELGNDRIPKLATKIEIEGRGRKLRLPVTIDPLPLKGVDGHFGLGTTVDLSSFQAGEYHLRLTITDTLAGRVFAREETIRVID